MKKQMLLVAVTAVISLAFVACTETATNTNANANMASPKAEATPAGTPKYTEEQARQERERAKANKETIGETLDDAWIHTKIVAKLIGDTKTPERKINVDVVNGVVTLRGTVDTAEAKTEAERTAKETEGVKKVNNQLKVAPAAKAGNTNSKKATNTNKAKTIYE